MATVDKKFYNLFWTDSICQTIFSTPKAQLLEDEVELIVTKEKFYAQRLVLTNSQKRKIGNQIVKRNENESIELVHNLQNAVKKYVDEVKIEAYIKNKFGKAFNKIETDLKKTGGWLKLIFKLLGSLENEKDFFQLLSDYYLIPKEIENLTQLFSHIESEFNSQTREFFKKENLSDLAITIDLISIYYNNRIKNNLVAATKHYIDLLYDTENYQDRLDFFDNLYEIGVIKGGKIKSYYECVNCPPNTFNGVLTTNLKPSNLKLKCPCCGKELYYIVPYELDKIIYEHIIQKDGLLFSAICYLLEQYNYNFSTNQKYPPDVELDLCLLNDQNQIYEIIEVKMFKTDRPEDTQLNNLREAVAQTKKYVNKLMDIEIGFKNIRKNIVININNESVNNKVKKELENDMKEYNIFLYTIPEFYLKIKR